MKLTSLRKIVLSLIVIAGLIKIGIVGTAYYYVRIFMSPAHLEFNGHSQAELAAQYRAELHALFPVRDITFASDGITLAGMVIERPHAAFNLLLCHGYRGTKESLRFFPSLFPDANICLFDFRAHGESGGNLITFGYNESHDVHAARAVFYEALKEKDKHLPFLVLGSSMGGAAVLKAAREDALLCDGCIIDSSFASLEAMIYHSAQRIIEKVEAGPANRFYHNIEPRIPTVIHRPFLWVVEKAINFNGRAPISSLKGTTNIQNIAAPVLIIHSEADTTTPVKNAYELYVAAEQGYTSGTASEIPPTLWLGPPAPHGALHREYPKEYKAQVGNFLKLIEKHEKKLR